MVKHKQYSNSVKYALGIMFILVQSKWSILTEGDVIHCPTVCMCDNVERFVMCEEKNLSHLPFPLPGNTRILGLSKNLFTRLSSSMFIDTGLEETLNSLAFYDNRIQKIEPGSFLGLQKLENLWLFGNQLLTLKKGTFEGLNKVSELDLSRNDLVEIEVGAFDDLDELKVLHLWGNDLITLHPNTFRGLNTVSNLTLGDNKFTGVPTSTFQHLTNLSSLEILNLPIKTLKANAFSALVKLKRLHIGDWPLNTIEKGTFAGLDNLCYLSLYRCNLIKIPQAELTLLPNLKHLLLSNNKNIKMLRNDDFQGNRMLEDLRLSNVGLETLHESPFHQLTLIKCLDLSYNKLLALPTHIFLQLENLHSLNLSHNLIKTLSAPVFISLPLLNNMDLSDNPLVCDCDIKWLKSLQEIRIRKQFSLHGKCSDPLFLEGKEIVTLPPRKFVCKAPFFHKNATVVAMMGTNVWLTCQPDEGVPTPKAHWKIAHKDRKHIIPLKNGTLYINKVKKSDYGSYSCVATNNHGIANHTVFLFEHLPVTVVNGTSTTEILVGILVAIIIVIAVIFIYKRYRHHKFQGNLYDAMLGETENQRLSMKNISKGE